MVQRIENVLSDAIRNGSLPSGYRLREIPLASHFDCSTTPVREAIRRLESAGLVTVAPRRGAVVRAISLDGIHELYELRMLLEPTMARRAAEHAQQDSKELADFTSLVDAQAAQADIGRLEGGLLDASIHAAIAVLGGNRAIAKQVSRATQQIEAVQARAQKWAPRGLESAYHFHSILLEAIRDGDGDLAENVMREHLKAAEQGVIDGLEQNSSNDE